MNGTKRPATDADRIRNLRIEVAEWRKTDERHLDRFGQHVPCSILALAEIVESIINKEDAP